MEISLYFLIHIILVAIITVLILRKRLYHIIVCKLEKVYQIYYELLKSNSIFNSR